MLVERYAFPSTEFESISARSPGGASAALISTEKASCCALCVAGKSDAITAGSVSDSDGAPPAAMAAACSPSPLLI